MPKNRTQSIIYISISILFFTLAFSNIIEIKAQTQQTLEDNQAVVTNINDCYPNDEIAITWNVISGPGINVYLRNQSTILLFGAPSSNIIQRELNSMSGTMNHTVVESGDYSVVFINDGGSTIVFEYSQTYTPVFMTMVIIISFIVIAIVSLVVVVVVAVVLIKKRRDKPQHQKVMKNQEEKEFKQNENKEPLY